MKRLITTAAGATLALALSAGSVLAVIPGTLDQQQTDTSSSVTVSSTVILAQTFTAGITGNLTDVGIYVGAFAAPSLVPAVVTPAPGSNLAIAVVPVSGGNPVTSGTPLFADFATVASTPAWHDFLVPSAAPVVSGTQYAILVEAINSRFLAWGGDCTNAYSGGQALAEQTAVISPTWQTVSNFSENYCLVDFAFHTYVQAPAPSPTPIQSVQGETSNPTTVPTAPPTSTSTTDGSSPMSGLLLVVAGLATAAAMVTIRRYYLMRR